MGTEQIKFRESPWDPKDTVVLVVGACVMDRILTVETYPRPDRKVRATSPIVEVGGGNAANTAVALARLGQTVRLLTAIGDDVAGKCVWKELGSEGVDTSRCRVVEGATTGVTTVLVSTREGTRTCIFANGTCALTNGESDPNNDNDSLWEDVVHVHSDTRHTETAAVVLAEARRRGLTVSVDVERDRGPLMDSLLQAATLVFTNRDQMTSYLDRVWKDREECDRDTAAIRLIQHFERNYGLPFKDLVITRGEQGAIHISHTNDNDNDNDVHNDLKWKLRRVGVLKEAHVVDTTGAGDAFIAGFLYSALNVCEDPDTCLKLGSWVAGRKLRCLGSRQGLPNRNEAKELFGVDKESIQKKLTELIVTP